MKRIYKVAKEVKEQIIKRVKEEGVPVADAAKEHGISEAAIYRWLGKGAEAGSTAELLRLKRDKRSLLELVGEMTLKLSESQKKN
ncbi:MAG: transposase [Candidatus Nealsonbacteria bacterium]|nr:transposase [Candidatus Nealsonbacteria bacterium]